MAAFLMQSEENARQSYERLRLALGASSACIWERDTRTDEVFLSEGWAALTGAPPGETRTTLQALIALVHPEDVDTSVDMATEAVKGLRDEYAFEHRVRTVAGDWRWILTRGKVTERGADGRALRLSGINIDIHGRKTAELALAESEARYRSLIALSQHTYWETDSGHRLTGASDGSAIVAALPVAEQIGKAFWDAPSIIPDEAGWRALRLKLERHEPFRHFEVSRRADGGSERHHVLAGEPRFDQSGRFLGYRGFSRDVTDRVIAARRAREADERLRSAIDNLDQPVVLTDAQDRFVLTNRAFRELNRTLAKVIEPGQKFEDYLRAGLAGGNYPDAAGHEAEWLEARLAERRNPAGAVERQRPGGRWFLISDKRLADGGMVRFSSDITDRKRAEMALQGRERELQLIMDSVPVMISRADRDERYVFVNRAYENLMERTSAELLGRRISEIVPPEIYAQVKPDIDRVIAGETVRFERTQLRSDGETRHLDVLYVPDLDSQGRSVGWFALHWDVTGTRKAEDALRRANERLESALEGGMVSIWDTDLETGEAWLSDGWAGLIGGPPGETRTTIQELMSLTHPDDLPDVLRLSAETIKGEREFYTEEHRVQTLSGEWRWVLSRGKVAERDARGRARRMSGTNVDITERKRAEEALATSEARFRAIFERSNAGIAMWAIDGKYLAANRAYCNFVGYAADELVGRMSAGELRLPGDDEGFDLTGRMVRGDVAFTSRDRRYRRRDGSEVWGRTTVAAVKGNDGNPEHFISVVIDITEARQARERNERINIELEERVAERTVELRSALKELDAFAYSVSHDLRAPVGAVSGLAHLLRTGEAGRLSDDGKRLLGMIEGNAERMVGLIEGLLRLSQLGRGAIRRAPLSMVELARDVLRDVAAGTRAEIRIGDLPGCDGDPMLLRQVWANLIGNALKYSRTRDAARVDIGWDAQNRAYFVRDNGVGFDMQYASKLFGAFERLHGEAEFEGSGIGLAIVQRILERHGGKIWADAAPDCGATFWFSVPAAGAAKKR